MVFKTIYFDILFIFSQSMLSLLLIPLVILLYLTFALQGPVARSLVSANRWLRGIKMYRFPWYLTLVSTNHASSNPGQARVPGKQINLSSD